MSATTPAHASVAFTFACTDCGRRAPQAIECPCGAGPLVDLSKPEFRQMVVEIEDRRAESHQQTLHWVGVIGGVGVGLLIVFFAPTVISAIPLPVPFAPVVKTLLFMIAFAIGLSKAAGAVWQAPRRFPELVRDRGQGAKLPANLTAPRRATVIGVSLALAAFAAIGLAVPFVRAHIAEEELAHKRAVAKRWDALAECVATERPAAVRTEFFGEPTELPKRPSGKDAWYDECRKPLGSLWESLDERSADAPLRNTLGETMACGGGKCDASRLDHQWVELEEAARASGHAWSDPRPRRDELDSPFASRRPLRSPYGGLGTSARIDD